MKTYTINEIAMMTGFTIRSLRNDIRAGLPEGEKALQLCHYYADQTKDPALR